MIQMPALLTVLTLITAGAAEEPGIQAYGDLHPSCLEWSDGCMVCRRDEGPAPACSTPGLSCQPHAIGCDESRSGITKGSP
jgi:hypothetical protein